jgi:hypothetical protein
MVPVYVCGPEKCRRNPEAFLERRFDMKIIKKYYGILGISEELK